MIGILLGSAESNGKRGLCPRWVRSLADHDHSVVAIKSGKDQAYYDHILSLISGVMMPGGDTDVFSESCTYQRHSFKPEFDADRDQSAFYIAQICADRGIPALGVCRGMQEMNVALGGGLSEVNGHDFGYENQQKREAEVHDIVIREGGLLNAIYALNRTPRVNSIHRFGIKKRQKADVFEIEAYAMEDDVIEAVSIPDHPFYLGVQFHAELKSTHGLNEAIMARFSEAAHEYKGRKSISYTLLDPEYQMMKI